MINRVEGSVMFTDNVRHVIFRKCDEDVYEYHPWLVSNMDELGIRGPCKIRQCDPSKLKIPCIIGHKYFYNVYIDVGLPMNIMSLFH